MPSFVPRRFGSARPYATISSSPIDGVAEVRSAAALDPLSPYVSTEFGHALLIAGRYGEAADQLRKAIALDPTRNRPYNLLGRALSLQGRTAEALDVFAKSTQRGSPPGASLWLPCAQVGAGRRAEAVALLDDQLRSEALLRALAQTHSCLGDEERALEYLEKLAAENEPGLPEMLQAPEQAWLRQNPRFAALRKHVHLAP